ncbi:MAG: hypothetical protein HGB28_05135, partial [Oscillochloris sp.]|nr:hypothetical protein [Oscillochloris sp.]
MRSEQANEQPQERTLSRLGLLSSPGDPAFDRLATLAARLLDVPIALVTVATAE